MSKPTIKCAKNGPYVVKGLEVLQGLKDGKQHDTEETIALCRCGGSQSKPFCDGTHAKNGFSDEKLEGRPPDRRDNYDGKGITIHDNRGICAHAGVCTDNLKSVWRLKTEPWIDPNGASVEEIVETIKKCPSGALSYSIDGVEYRDRESDPMILIAPNGPYVIRGGCELRDTPFGEGASTEHYDLCRCGGSKNKPFCDGTHWTRKFDEHAG